MAQYKDFNGANFGNAHQSDTTYKVVKAPLADGNPSSGSIYLSGSGGYVNSATGITKATLDAGINIKIDDNDVTRSIVEVENGTCDGEQAFATWVFPTPTPTPTITPTPTNLAIYSNSNFFSVRAQGDLTSSGGDASASTACGVVGNGSNSRTLDIHKDSGNGQSNNYPQVNDVLKISGSPVNGGYLSYSGNFGSGPETKSVAVNAGGQVQTVADC